MLLFIKRRENNEQEKTNKDNVAADLTIKYNDNDQSAKTVTKDVTPSALFANVNEKIYSRNKNMILPPSKPYIGNKFNAPRKNDDINNISAKLFDGI